MTPHRQPLQGTRSARLQLASLPSASSTKVPEARHGQSRATRPASWTYASCLSGNCGPSAIGSARCWIGPAVGHGTWSGPAAAAPTPTGPWPRSPAGRPPAAHRHAWPLLRSAAATQGRGRQDRDPAGRSTADLQLALRQRQQACAGWLEANAPLGPAPTSHATTPPSLAGVGGETAPETSPRPLQADLVRQPLPTAQAVRARSGPRVAGSVRRC